MTAEEAQAFVGDASCKVTILQDDKLFLEAPSTQPRARSKRQRRDTSSDPLDLTVTTLAFCLNPRHREREASGISTGQADVSLALNMYFR